MEKSTDMKFVFSSTWNTQYETPLHENEFGTNSHVITNEKTKLHRKIRDTQQCNKTLRVTLSVRKRQRKTISICPDTNFSQLLIK